MASNDSTGDDPVSAVSSTATGDSTRPRVVASTPAPHPPEPTESHADARAQPVGHFLPADMPRAQKVRIMQAEALWRAGSLKVSEIATQVERHETLVYEWARTYHWPPRADVVAVARNALSVEMLRAAVARARGQASPPSNEGEKAEVDAFTPGVNPAPPGAIDFAAERNRRPMSDEDTRQQAITEQAAADAEAARLTNEYAHAISAVVDEQRQVANELAEWGAELLRDARAHRARGKERLAELRKSAGKKYDSTRALNEGIGQFARITTALKAAIDIQWRVWQLDALASGSGGASNSDGTPVVPVNAGSYEDYVHAAERNGTNLTPP